MKVPLWGYGKSKVFDQYFQVGNYCLGDFLPLSEYTWSCYIENDFYLELLQEYNTI